MVEGNPSCYILPKNHAREFALVSSGARWFPDRESAWEAQSPAIRPAPRHKWQTRAAA
jgi:hypothetical protein